MKKLTRTHHNRMIAGVCGGFSEYFEIDVSLVRVLWVFFTLFGGSGVLGYILASMIIPDKGASISDDDTVQKIETRSTFWTIVLLTVGFIVIVQHDYLFRSILYSFWGTSLNSLFSLGLIIVGAYLLFYRRENLIAFFNRDAALPLHLSLTDKKLAGVCGGIGESINVDPNIIRLIWVFGTFMTAGTGAIIYAALAILLPKTAYAEVDE